MTYSKILLATAIAATIGERFSSAQVGAAYRCLHEEAAGDVLVH